MLILFIMFVKPVLYSVLACFFWGLIFIRAIQAEWQHFTVWQYLQGILYGILALGAWSWYVIYNTYLLQRNPTINPRKWTTLIGVITLALTLFGILLRAAIVQDITYTDLFSVRNQGINFIAASLVLGILCSWTAFALWNTASSKLPSEISGQLAILETVFGLIFIYLVQHQWPTFIEMLGVAFILGGVWKGLYNFERDKRLQI